MVVRHCLLFDAHIRVLRQLRRSQVVQHAVWRMISIASRLFYNRRMPPISQNIAREEDHEQGRISLCFVSERIMRELTQFDDYELCIRSIRKKVTKIVLNLIKPYS